MDDLIGLFLVAVPLVYAIVQTVMLRRWQGGWRWAAALPLPAWGGWALLLAVQVAGDTSAHNLFPFEILIGAGTAMIYLGALVVARAFAKGEG